MQERILRKVISENKIARELAQKVSHLGLVSPDKFAECLGILLRQHLCDKFMIVDPAFSRL